LNPALQSVPAGTGRDAAPWHMPEEHTPLYHTAIYSQLTYAQRGSYNRLNALYFHEQIYFFERVLAGSLIGPFLDPPIAASLPSGLGDGLRAFVEEENEHSEMFLQLNRDCAPSLYTHRDFFFISAPRSVLRLMQSMASHPFRFPLFLWLAHLMEERALYFSKCFLNRADSIDRRFVEAQRRHLADEIGHVRCDHELIRLVWPATPGWLRSLNVRLLSWMIGELFSAPKRSGLRVVSEWIKLHPELRPLLPGITKGMRALGSDRAYLQTLYHRGNIPMTLGLFDQWPEFKCMESVMPAYQWNGKNAG